MKSCEGLPARFATVPFRVPGANFVSSAVSAELEPGQERTATLQFAWQEFVVRCTEMQGSAGNLSDTRHPPALDEHGGFSKTEMHSGV